MKCLAAGGSVLAMFYTDELAAGGRKKLDKRPTHSLASPQIYESIARISLETSLRKLPCFHLICGNTAVNLLKHAVLLIVD